MGFIYFYVNKLRLISFGEFYNIRQDNERYIGYYKIKIKNYCIECYEEKV